MIFFQCLQVFVVFPLFAVITCWADAPHGSSGITAFEEDFPLVDERLIQGDELLEAGLYSRAIAAFREVAENAKEQQTPMQARFRLGLAYFSQGDYAQAIEPLQSNVSMSSAILSPELAVLQGHSLFLLALTQKKMHHYAEAKDLLTSYIHAAPESPPFYDEACFELGTIDFFLGERAEAEKIFHRLSVSSKKLPLQRLATIYLARLNLAESNSVDASTRLKHLLKGLPSQDPLSFEISYLLGEASFKNHDYSKAIDYFTSSLSTKMSSWYPDAMYRLGWSYLKNSEDFTRSQQERLVNLKKAEEVFQKMVDTAPQERGYLALAQCYLSQLSRQNDQTACAKAETLLAQTDRFQSNEAKSHALLLRAEAAPSYQLRDAFYRKLTEEASSTFQVTSWYMRGLNDLEYGDVLDKAAAEVVYRSSAEAFAHAFSLLSGTPDSVLAGHALKNQAIATSHFNLQQAWRLLDTLIKDYPIIWKSMENPGEALYLHGHFAGRLAEGDHQEEYLKIAAESLNQAAAEKNSKYGDLALIHLGGLYYQKADYQKAEAVYLQLADTYPDSALAGEAWYWAARCAECVGKSREVVNQRKRHVFEYYPDSPFAAEAYFTIYPYEEYLQGDKNAMKHLQNFEGKFSQTPFLIEAYYLIGLDDKRDRKTLEGKWIKKKSLTEAIDAFQHVETLFDTLEEKGLLPQEKVDYYVAMRYQAMLERAIANLAIAEEARGAKQKVYLDYAEEVFAKLVNDLNDTSSPYTQRLMKAELHPPMIDESTFGLAQVYIHAEKDSQADEVLTRLIDRYQQGNFQKRYYLARSWDERGRIALRRQEYLDALNHFKQAEEVSKNGVLSTDQRLDVWIQQSLCCRALGRFDDAVLTLSKVVNDDAVSSLRLKAMYLRAETYETQGRPELARKQLESLVKKGGVWAQKAREKLENDYGY